MKGIIMTTVHVWLFDGTELDLEVIRGFNPAALEPLIEKGKLLKTADGDFVNAAAIARARFG